MVFQLETVAIDADHSFHAVVEGRDVVIADRLIHAQPVARERLEITRTPTRRMAAPEVGPPAEHAGAFRRESRPALILQALWGVPVLMTMGDRSSARSLRRHWR
jgi:hypothetical protein